MRLPCEMPIKANKKKFGNEASSEVPVAPTKGTIFLFF
jgi:hypothetical protein